jgi:hypothetical protein
VEESGLTPPRPEKRSRLSDTGTFSPVASTHISLPSVPQLFPSNPLSGFSPYQKVPPASSISPFHGALLPGSFWQPLPPIIVLEEVARSNSPPSNFAAAARPCLPPLGMALSGLLNLSEVAGAARLQTPDLSVPSSSPHPTFTATVPSPHPDFDNKAVNQ